MIKSTLIQVMAWCRQAASHHLNRCWSKSLSPNDVTGPQSFKLTWPLCAVCLIHYHDRLYLMKICNAITCHEHKIYCIVNADNTDNRNRLAYRGQNITIEKYLTIIIHSLVDILIWKDTRQLLALHPPHHCVNQPLDILVGKSCNRRQSKN